jgi:hypothetical protein
LVVGPRDFGCERFVFDERPRGIQIMERNEIAVGLEAEAREAIAELGSKRSIRFSLKAVEPVALYPDVWRLRFVGAPAMSVKWIKGRDSFKRAVYEAIERQLSVHDTE